MAHQVTNHLLVLVLICAAVGFGWSQVHNGLMTKWLERSVPSAGDEIVIMSLTLASLTGLALAAINHFSKLHLLVSASRASYFCT